MPYSPLISKIRIHNPNKKGSSSANRNYINYIATREGVSLEQVNGINDLLHEEGMMEAEIKEEVVHQEAGNKEYLEYMARRPRSHGLFGNVDTSDLKAISSEVAALTKSGKIIYRGVISLGEKDGEELGFRNVNAWNNYLTRVMPEIADTLGVSCDHTWVAAFHAEESHPHVHYMLWDNKDKIKSPYIHVATQQKIRIYLESEMFDDAYERGVKMALQSELSELYGIRNMERASILDKTADIMQNVKYVPGVDYERAPARPSHVYMEKIAKETEKLISDLPEHGSLKYQYLSPQAKDQLNTIINLVMDKTDIQSSVNTYMDSVEAGLKLKGKTKAYIKSRLDIEEKAIRKRIGNKILSEIKKEFVEGQIIPISQKEERGIENEMKSVTTRGELSSPLEDETFRGELSSPLEESVGRQKNAVSDKKYFIDWNKPYKQAMEVLYGENPDVEKAFWLLKDQADQQKAIKLLEEMSQKDNAMAQYKLGSIYADPENVEYYDLKKAVEYLEKSAEQGNEYAQYKLGTIYYFGKGVEKNQELGKYWLEKSAEQGNEFAKDVLENQMVPLGFSYCLLKGVLSSMEALNRSSAAQNMELIRSQSKQVWREKNLHKDNAQNVEL